MLPAADPDINAAMTPKSCSFASSFLQRAVVPAIAAAALLCSSAAFAQQNYILDDGMAEDSVGLTNGGDFIWLNSFSVTNNNRLVLSISVAFGAPSGANNAALNGLPFTVYLWSDPNNDGSPTDAMVLTSATGTIASAGTNTFITVNITPTMVLTNNFFVGVLLRNQPSGAFPAAFDTTAPTFTNRSFAAGGAAGTGNPNNLTANQLPVGTIESFGLSGNWMVRANAVPEPSTYALGALGLGVLAAARRRRNSKRS